MSKKILCPTDFSDGSKAALQAAIVRLDPDGELVLVHVLKPPFFYGPENGFPEALLADLRADAERMLEVWRRDAIERGARRVRTHLRSAGAPWHEIVDVARHAEVDEIVISTHGRTGLEHVLLGSVTEKVVRHAPCPVYVVRERGNYER